MMVVILFLCIVSMVLVIVIPFGCSGLYLLDRSHFYLNVVGSYSCCCFAACRPGGNRGRVLNLGCHCFFFDHC